MFLKRSLLIYTTLIFLFPSFALSASIEKEPAGTIYLTFDADMTPLMKEELEEKKVTSWYDPNILTFLKKEHIPASIFTTGMFAEIYPELIKDLGTNPLFSIENHTYDHAAFTYPCYKLKILTKHQEKVEEITKTQEVIKQLTGKEPQYVRLPGLCKTEADDILIKKLGLEPSNTGIISGDVKQKEYKKIVSSILNQVHPGDNVIIMHLGGPHAPETGKAIQVVIPELIKKGYIFIHL